MRIPKTTLAAIAAIAFLAPPSADAAESYDNCSGFIDSVPATITTQGVWCLRADLSTAISNGNAITIATNNVTLDCNDFKLGGLAAGAATTAYGVRADSRLNAVVKNCNIRGFSEGVAFFNGNGHVVENSRFDGNTWIGIRINSSNSLARGNLVVDTGGSSVRFGAYGIVGSDGEGGVHVIDNTVAGVSAPATQPGYGIWTSGLLDGSVGHNRVRGVVPSESSTAIAVVAGGRTAVHDNILHGPAVPATTGITCGSDVGTAFGNFIQGFADTIVACAQANNIINPN